MRAYANKLLTDTLVSNGMTVSEAKQSYIDSARNNMIIEKMQNRIFAEVEPTEEELYDMYEEELQVQKDLFDESPASYFTYDLYAAYGNNCIPLYIPEGFIRVRQILVEDEETANELLTRLMEGEDFETLLNQYNTDPGMADEANADGYLVGEGANYLEEFLEAALALENDGDISPWWRPRAASTSSSACAPSVRARSHMMRRRRRWTSISPASPSPNITPR